MTCPRSLAAGVSCLPAQASTLPLPSRAAAFTADWLPTCMAGSSCSRSAGSALAGTGEAAARSRSGGKGAANSSRGGPWQATGRRQPSVDTGTQEDPCSATWNRKANAPAPVECGEPVTTGSAGGSGVLDKGRAWGFREIEIFMPALLHPGCATWKKVTRSL